MWTQRDQFTNAQIAFSDNSLSSTQHLMRLKNHLCSEQSKAPLAQKCPDLPIVVGDLMYLHSDGNKSRGCDWYLVTSVDPPFCNIRKFVGSQLRSSSYRIRLSECFKVPTKMSAPLLHRTPHTDSHNDGDTEEQARPPAPPDIPEDISTPPPYSHNQNVVPVLAQTPTEIVTDCPDLPVPDEDDEAQSPPVQSILATDVCQRRSSRPRCPAERFKDYVTDF